MAFDQYNRLGHPSQYSYVQKRINGDVTLNGDAFGVSAIIIGSGTTGTINLSNGGTIPLQDLRKGVILEISAQSITNIVGTLYLLGRSKIEVPVSEIPLTWILENGQWDDNGYWVDTEVWKDN